MPRIRVVSDFAVITIHEPLMTKPTSNDDGPRHWRTVLHSQINANRRREREIRRKKERSESEMAWCAARSFPAAAMDIAVLRRRALFAAAGIGCVSVAGTAMWRSSSSKRSLPFACLGISTDTRKLRWFHCLTVIGFGKIKLGNHHWCNYKFSFLCSVEWEGVITEAGFKSNFLFFLSVESWGQDSELSSLTMLFFYICCLNWLA